MKTLLVNYFIKPMKRTTDLYKFHHAEGLGLHELYNFAKTIFEDKSMLQPESINILEHLYRQSNHPNIKSGEVFVALFRDLLYEDELVDAIGIFKSEQKNTFLQVTPEGEVLGLNSQEGINVNKLDKGALILNVEQEDGYRILSVDNNQYDTHYWLFDFLRTDRVKDDVFNTFSYLDMCNNFSKEVIMPANDKHEQMKFIADSVDYFDNNEHFNFDEFTRAVAPTDDVATELRNYQESYELADTDSFTISKPALKTARRQFKDTIKLDTNIQIRLDISDPELGKQYLDKGYDEEKQMYYYKVYFNEEI